MCEFRYKIIEDTELYLTSLKFMDDCDLSITEIVISRYVIFVLLVICENSNVNDKSQKFTCYKFLWPSKYKEKVIIIYITSAHGSIVI